MSGPRLRIIAGPNGSGKSTLVEFLRNNYSFPFGFYLNADDLEKSLKENGKIDFSEWSLEIDQPVIQQFLVSHPLSSRLGKVEIRVTENTLIANSETVGGYFAAVIADFIRKQWLASNASFTFETVMSGQDKLELLKVARETGFRTYSYSVCTDDPEINRRRVAFRVAGGGHDVPPEKIVSRYHASLANLRSAIRFSDRAYLFDNSGNHLRFIAEFEGEKLFSVSGTPPEWFIASGIVSQS